MMNRTPTEEQKRRPPSSNLGSQGSSKAAHNNESQLVAQMEKAYERLDTLYEISRLLASFDGVESMFPKILSRASTTFPLLTAVLIENKGERPQLAVWHTKNIPTETVNCAIAHAKKSSIYLLGTSSSRSAELQEESPFKVEFDESRKFPENGGTFKRENYLLLPLIVDDLPAFGTLQLEGSAPLSEQDLAFAVALANLIAVALDRFYVNREDRKNKERKIEEGRRNLMDSQEQVAGLESERKLRENFVSLLTHDLRTPLSVAKMSAQLLLRDPSISELSRTLATRIEGNVKQADLMIGNLLDANRIRSGEKLPLSIEKFELSEVIKSTIEELSIVHGDRFVLKALKPIEGFWDRRGIRRIIENLCTNAVKYGERETPIILSLSQKKSFAQIEVQNTGEVISPEDQKSLFQQFRRAKGVQGSSIEGWGIGLTLVQGVAEAHCGNVRVESSLEEGTIFTVTLPIDARDPNSGQDL